LGIHGKVAMIIDGDSIFGKKKPGEGITPGYKKMRDNSIDYYCFTCAGIWFCFTSSPMIATQV
jgi:hypothetical protein